MMKFSFDIVLAIVIAIGLIRGRFGGFVDRLKMSIASIVALFLAPVLMSVLSSAFLTIIDTASSALGFITYVFDANVQDFSKVLVMLILFIVIKYLVFGIISVFLKSDGGLKKKAKIYSSSLGMLLSIIPSIITAYMLYTLFCCITTIDASPVSSFIFDNIWMMISTIAGM